MSKLRTWVVAQLRRDEEEAQSLAEYGLILALVAVVCIAALTTLGGGIAQTLQDVAGQL